MDEHKTVITYYDSTQTIYWKDGQWVLWDGTSPPANQELPPPPRQQ